VILDAGEDRFGASIRALEHAFAAYDRADLLVRGEKYAGADADLDEWGRTALAGC